MARRVKTWEDIGNVKRRQAGRSAQMAADAAWRAAHSQVTVPDGATLDSLAQQNGTTPEDLLAANPNVNNIKTGMVLSVPNMGAPGAYRPGASPVPGSEAWRVQNVGGLPSNAALGGATTNPVGWNGDMGQAPRTTPLQVPGYQSRPIPGSTPQMTPQTFSQTSSFLTPRPPMGPPAPTTQAPTNNYVQRTSNQMLNELKYRVESGMQITPDMLQFMIRKNMLIPPTRPPTTTVTTGGGGGGGRGRGRGRGGGGGGRGGTPARVPAQAPERLPAFSNGAGFGGLINWRI